MEPNIPNTISYNNLFDSTNDPNLQNQLQHLNLLFGDEVEKSNKQENQNSGLLTNATQIVVSFVFLNKQASLFNLLIQMLTTNSFTATSLATSSQLPFQPSPTPTPPKSSPNNNNNSNSNSNIEDDNNSSCSTPPLSNEVSKSSQMFNILHEAIGAVSQQFQKNFYLYLLEKLDNSNNNNTQVIANHEALIAGCLSFINHMMSCAPTFFDCERYRQLLSAQGVNDVIKGYIKSVHPNIRSELLNFQKHKTISIKSAKLTPNTPENRDNILSSFLTRLVKMSFPSDNPTYSGLSDQEKFKRLGFDSSDPYDELLSTGILGLRNLIYFSARYSRIYNEILEAQSSPNNPNTYSFIRVGLNLTNVLYEIYIEDENIYEIIFDQDDWFEELFCISFELFDEIWEREGKNEEDFIPVLVKTRTILSRLKWTNPESIGSFQTILGNVLDEMWTKIENIKEEKEMTARVGGLSDSIIGLPHLPNNNNNSSNNLNSPSYRFQKFFGERFKSHRKSTEFSIHLDDSASVNSEKSSASNSSTSLNNNNNNSGSGSDIHRSPSLHRVHTKSLSFKKIFLDLKDFNSDKKKEDQGSSDSGNNSNNNSNIQISSSIEISKNSPRDISDTQSQSSNNDESQSNLEKLGTMAKKFIKTVKNKTSSTSTRNLNSSTSNYDINGSGEVPNSSTPNTAESSPMLSSSSSNNITTPNGTANSADSPGIGGSIKSSGSYIYKSVRKAMVTIEKKSKTITRKVKRKKEKKAKSNNSNNSVNNSNNSSLNNSNNPISIYANGDHEFQPSLDLDFDRNSDDSSYEYTDEEIEVEIDDSMSINSSNFDNKLTKSKSVEVLSSNQKLVVVVVSTDTSIDTSGVGGGNSISSSQDVIIQPPPISISRTESDQSLTDAASFNSAIKQKQQQQQQQNHEHLNPNKLIQQHQSGSSGENSPRSNSASPRGSPKVSRAHTLDLKKPVLSRAPIPAAFISNTSQPTNSNSMMTKSTSIKHLVNFFEVKSVSSVPTLKKEKSFRSDVSKEDDNQSKN